MFDFDKPFPCYIQKKWMTYNERVKVRSLFRLCLRVLLRSQRLSFISELDRPITHVRQAAIEEVYLMNDEDMAKAVLDTIKPRHVSLASSSLPPLENDDYGLLRILAFLSCTMSDRAVNPPVCERLLSLDLRGQSLPFVAYRYVLSAAELAYEKLLRTLMARRLLYLEWLLTEGFFKGEDFEAFGDRTPSSDAIDAIRTESAEWMQQRWKILCKTLEFLPEYVVPAASRACSDIPTQTVSQHRPLLHIKGIDNESRKRYNFRYYPTKEESILRNSERVLICMVLDDAEDSDVFANMPSLELDEIVDAVNSHLLASLVTLELELMDTGVPSNVHVTIDISVNSEMLRDECGDFAALIAVVQRQFFVLRFPYEVGLLKLTFGGVKVGELREHATHTLLSALARLESPPPQGPCLERLSVDSDYLFSFGNAFRFEYLKSVCLKVPPGNAHPMMVSRLASALSSSPFLTSICLHGFNLRGKLEHVFKGLGDRHLFHVGLTDCHLEEWDFEFLGSSELFSFLNTLTLCESSGSVMRQVIPILQYFCDSLRCLTIKDFSIGRRLMAETLDRFGDVVLQLKELRLLRAHFRANAEPPVLLRFLEQMSEHRSLVDVEVDEPFRGVTDAAVLFSSRCEYDKAVYHAMEEGAARSGRSPVQVIFKREAAELHWRDYEPVGDVWLPPIDGNP